MAPARRSYRLHHLRVAQAVALTILGTAALTTAAAQPITTSEGLISVLAEVYRTMDLDLYSTLFTRAAVHGVESRFIQYEPMLPGDSEWGTDEELRIHRRMFIPESIGPDEDPLPYSLWVKSIDVELVRLTPFTERFDLYRSEQDPQAPLDRKRWRADESVYATNVVWHTRGGPSMGIAGRARFVVIQDLVDCVDDGFYVYVWEDLGPGGGGIARADP